MLPGQQVILVWRPKGHVRVIQPDDGDLKGPAGVEAGDAWVGEVISISSYSFLEELRSLGSQEVEVAHKGILPPRTGRVPRTETRQPDRDPPAACRTAACIKSIT